MSKRPRERESELLRVLLLDRNDSVSPLSDSLASWIAPLDVATFKKEFFRRRALVVRVHPKLRETRLESLRDVMDNFRPMTMLEESNSEAIHVWMKTGAGVMKSIQCDAAQAKTCYDAGHPLYFRGSEALESLLVPALARDLGMGFAASHRDGARRGEIETFVAKAGHVTEWHWDFQENFTVQLKGTKKWSFYTPTIPSPHRACATHFTGDEYRRTLHTQFQTVRAEQPEFNGVPEGIEDRCESVVLQEGDVLYHPAGTWHKVEAVGTEPSLSINISLFPATWADVISESLTHAMITTPQLRERISYSDTNEAQQQLAVALRHARHLLNEFQPNDLLPTAVCDPDRRPQVIFWDSTGAIRSDCKHLIAFAEGRLRRNRLQILSRTPEEVAFPVCVDVDGSAESDSESDQERTATSVAGYSRYDLTGNYLADESSFGPPAVAATFFVAPEHETSMDKLAACGMQPLSARALPAPPLLVGTFVSLGYLSPVQ